MSEEMFDGVRMQRRMTVKVTGPDTATRIFMRALAIRLAGIDVGFDSEVLRIQFEHDSDFVDENGAIISADEIVAAWRTMKGR